MVTHTTASMTGVEFVMIMMIMIINARTDFISASTSSITYLGMYFDQSIQTSTMPYVPRLPSPVCLSVAEKCKCLMPMYSNHETDGSNCIVFKTCKRDIFRH
jgi:hypothetical protein